MPLDRRLRKHNKEDKEPAVCKKLPQALQVPISSGMTLPSSAYARFHHAHLQDKPVKQALQLGNKRRGSTNKNATEKRPAAECPIIKDNSNR